MPSLKTILCCLAPLALAACAGGSQFDETGGIKITRSSCPAIAIPTYTGDVTLFDPPASREARAIDVVANMTNLRGGCTDGEMMATNATFEVQARRANASGARDVALPYFVTIVRGGTGVVSKQVGRIALHFADGQLRTTANGTASANVSRAAATLPEAVLTKITRKRKPTDADASVDPMSDPATRAAVSSASFEMLVGFQLSNDQLAYNATR